MKCRTIPATLKPTAFIPKRPCDTCVVPLTSQLVACHEPCFAHSRQRSIDPLVVRTFLLIIGSGLVRKNGALAGPESLQGSGTCCQLFGLRANRCAEAFRASSAIWVTELVMASSMQVM
jgi:hypothetical protein